LKEYNKNILGTILWKCVCSSHLQTLPLNYNFGKE